jgi:hypothetical protein
MNIVRFPQMRVEVMSSLASLADPEYQQRAWVRRDVEADTGRDNLTMCIHSLYDDNQVLPEPSVCVGTVLAVGDEVGRLNELGAILDRLIDQHGDAPDDVYLSAPEWQEVVKRASLALTAMVRAWALPFPSNNASE